jgi:hypothetical protein
MRRLIVRVVAFSLALFVLALLVLWFLGRSAQRKYEDALIGKTKDEAEVYFGSKPTRYITREQLRQREVECGWAAEVDAVAHWDQGRPGYQDTVVVVFDAAGKAIEVVYHSALSLWFHRSFGEL